MHGNFKGGVARLKEERACNEPVHILCGQIAQSARDVEGVQQVAGGDRIGQSFCRKRPLGTTACESLCVSGRVCLSLGTFSLTPCVLVSYLQLRGEPCIINKFPMSVTMQERRP